MFEEVTGKILCTGMLGRSNDVNTENSHSKESKSLEKQVFHSSRIGNGSNSYKYRP
jgi:hypothetical protein